MRRFRERSFLPLQLFDFLAYIGVVLLGCFEVRLCGKGRRIRFAERILVVFIRISRFPDFLCRRLLPFLRFLQPVCVLILAVVALLELVRSHSKRLLVLVNDALLQFHLTAER